MERGKLLEALEGSHVKVIMKEKKNNEPMSQIWELCSC